MTTTECSNCVTRLRNEGSSVKPGYLWYGGMFGDWEYCPHCNGTGLEPVNSGYQVVINGLIIMIEDLSREDLISELKKAIDKLEDIDTLAEQLRQNIEFWRDGK
jgi:hypothetical protein